MALGRAGWKIRLDRDYTTSVMHDVDGAAAAAGAGAGIYLTTRGAESLVDTSVDQAAGRAQAVMSEEGIAPDASSVEKGGDRREFKGKKGDLDVTIELERKSPTRTRVESAATLRRSSPVACSSASVIPAERLIVSHHHPSLRISW